MFQKVKRKWMYSYLGICLNGLICFVLLQIVSLIVRNRLLHPREILWIFVCLYAVMGLFLLVSGISLLRHEGKRIRNLVGIAFGFAMPAGNLFWLLLEDVFDGAYQIWRAGAFMICGLDFLLAGMILAGFIAARHQPAYDKDFAIIPGCSISKQGGLLPLLKGRTNRAIRFAWDQERATGKSVRYIPTGGQGPDEIMSEGSAMEMYLLSHSAEQYEILPEKKSVNTYENMLFAKRLIDEEMPDAKVCYVTTNYHVLRSGILARKAGLDAEGLASGTKWYFWPNGYVREMVGILSLFPWQTLGLMAVCAAASWIRL